MSAIMSVLLTYFGRLLIQDALSRWQLARPSAGTLLRTGRTKTIPVSPARRKRPTFAPTRWGFLGWREIGSAPRGRNSMAVAFSPNVPMSSGSMAGSSRPRLQDSVLTHGFHYASCVCSRANAPMAANFRGHRPLPDGSALGQGARFLVPYQRRRDRALPNGSFWRRITRRRLCGPIAWRGSEALGVSAQANKIHRSRPPRNGELISTGTAAQRHPPRPRRVPQA